MFQLKIPFEPERSQRLTFVSGPQQDLKEEFAEAVRSGLSGKPKHIPPRWFYDQRGSELFEQITKLPEYYLTRSEQQILESYAAEIIAKIGCPIELVEFGSGSSEKTRILIRASLDSQDEVRYTPIDISGEFLLETAELLVHEIDRLYVHAISADYEAGMMALPQPIGHRLFLFLGSSIGNLNAAESVRFLKLIRACCGASDRLLLGFDLVKDATIIQAAYNDIKGITAEFNRNLLLRINSELNGHFDVGTFRHNAPYYGETATVEMKLVSLSDQQVAIGDLNESYFFEEGEALITEHCQKYTLASIRELASKASFQLQHWWMDEREWFCVALLGPQDE